MLWCPQTNTSTDRRKSKTTSIGPYQMVREPAQAVQMVNPVHLAMVPKLPRVSTFSTPFGLISPQ
jgi:hypothetical protein